MIIPPEFFLIILSLFAIIWLLLAAKSACTINNTSDYFLAGRQLGILPISLTLMATQIGGGFLSGIAQESYNTGLYGILYALGISMGFIVLGLGVAGKLRSLQVKTTAEIFEKTYHSVHLKKCAALLFIGSLWGILVAQIVAFKTIATALEIKSDIFIIFFWLSIIVHTVLGGFKAVVSIDNIKQIFIVCIFCGIFVYSLAVLPHPSLSFANLINIQTLHFITPDTSLGHLLPTFLMPALFCLIEQDLAQCFFAARSKKTAALAAVYASIFLVLFSMAPVYFGMQTQLLQLPIIEGANPLIVYLAHVCNELFFLLAIVALITAITSTANSLLCATSSHITQDFNLSVNEAHGLRIAQSVTLITGIAALWASYNVNDQIISILTLSYELSATTLCVPLIATYIFSTSNKYAAWLSVIIGIVVFTVGQFFNFMYPRPLVTLTLSLIGFAIGLLATKNKNY